MAVIRIEQNGQMMDPDEATALRRQQQATPHPPPLDVGRLPPKEALNAERPLQQLFVEHPEVRFWINSKGKMRGSLSPADQEIARKILARYKEDKAA